MGFDDSPVKRWYEVAPQDPVAMREILDSEVEFSVCEGWPNGGTFQGSAAVLEDFFPGAARAWETIKPEFEEVIEAGDTFVVRGRYAGVARGTGTPFSTEFVHIWRVRGGRLVSLRQIADTVILADAMRGAGAVD